LFRRRPPRQSFANAFIFTFNAFVARRGGFKNGKKRPFAPTRSVDRRNVARFILTPNGVAAFSVEGRRGDGQAFAIKRLS
jgi:hypothetical protein